MQQPHVPVVLGLACARSDELSVDLEGTSYFLSTIELGVGDAPGMARWRKRVFVATSQMSADAADYFGLPRDQTVIMGSRIDV